ncbi:hypothetical protein EGK75_13540 [Neisseria weixii]|uniref:Adhesin n=1 Tax=Neisseria weixii TaxID=1853276 RepID=A0A3N4MJ63_9NEIS|nr:hypothetical protein [Neisseria weixii]RPD83085.1 hypothetical protein EGK74_13565 [Neisseria weixii]RPD83255.1 hypothetical protein EGK75_13540 [Neisseria weixii]
MELVSNVPVGRATRPALKSWFDWLKEGKPTSGGYTADPVLVGANGVHIPTTVGNKGNIPDNVSASVGNRNESGKPTGSSIPVPEPVKVKFGDNEVTYKSNSKHTPGKAGWNPKAGKEPKNSLELFKESSPISSSTTVRFTQDKDGNIHRFSRDPNNQWHWNGGTADKNNPLILDNKVKSELKNLGWKGKVLK